VFGGMSLRPALDALKDIRGKLTIQDQQKGIQENYLLSGSRKVMGLIESLFG
jgi:hypothetical protein